MLKRDKPKAVEEMKKLISQYKIVGLVSMHKLPTKQLQIIKNKLSDMAKIKMSKKVVLKKAIRESNIKGKEQLLDKVEGPAAFILSNGDPFKLFKKAKENKSPAPAKAGDVADQDIIVKAGPTSLAPGPAITQLQSVGIKTKVDSGKLTILKDVPVVKKGEEVSENVANVLMTLGMEPMEIGLNIKCLLDEGTFYSKDVLDVDEEEYFNKLQKAVNQAVNLSVNANYPTALTAELMIQKAFADARQLCLDANVLDKGFIDAVLSKAVKEAQALENIIKKKEGEK